MAEEKTRLQVAEEARMDREEKRWRDLETGTRDIAIACTDLTRCVEGIRQELSKTNARFDAIVADREKHQKRLDDRLEEIMESAQECDKAWAARLEQLEAHAQAMSKNNANLKRDLEKAKGGD